MGWYGEIFADHLKRCKAADEANKKERHESRRFQAAVAAMQALINAARSGETYPYKQLVEDAIAFADQLLLRLEETKK